MEIGNTALGTLARSCAVNIRFLWLLTVHVQSQYNHRFGLVR